MPPAYVSYIQQQKQQQEHEVADNTKANGAYQLNISTKGRIISDSDLLQHSKTTDLSLDPTGKPSEPADAKFHTHKLPSDIPPTALQASIEGAFQVAAENYFRGGAFARVMHDTIHRVSTIQ